MEFDFDGGELCLDFANTAQLWPNGQPTEDEAHPLRSYNALVAFAYRAGIIELSTARDLVAKAADSPQATEVLQHGLALRAAIFNTVLARLDDEVPDAAHLEAINTIYMPALRHRRFAWAGNGLEVEWSGLGEELGSILWPIADSAVRLLVGEDINLVRHCGGEDCDWLFIDRTRNHSRRWCSMSSCGNRAKAKRHYQKTRGKAD